jgi:hypothetical protein
MWYGGMMMADQVDRMIEALYSYRGRGRKARMTGPDRTDAPAWIDSIEPARCVQDRFLLRTFDRVRRELLSMPIPVWTEPGPVSGEIPWRTLHTED